jgi:hypothetical protein
MNLGIDLGWCVAGDRTANDRTAPAPGMFHYLPLLAQKHNVYIVSRVNDAQKEKSLEWLKNRNFFERTGINKDNLYYCFERRDKAIFQKGLKLDVFVDDRPDVFETMDDNVIKLCFNPTYKDIVLFEDIIKGLKNFRIVRGWLDVYNILQ